jgi:hypothetical protein
MTGPATSAHPESLFTVRYRMERGDYVALTQALRRQKPGHLAIELAVYFAALIGVGVLVAGSLDNLLFGLQASLRFPQVLLLLLLVFAGPVLALLTPQLLGLIAAAIYRRHYIADREVTLELTVEGIEGGATDLYSRVGWAAVNRLIETPKHLFIQISSREALIIPRRAVPIEDTYRNLLGFIRARTGLSTH